MKWLTDKKQKATYNVTDGQTAENSIWSDWQKTENYKRAVRELRKTPPHLQSSICELFYFFKILVLYT